MFERESVVLFPDSKKKMPPDELPIFSIIYGDI